MYDSRDVAADSFVMNYFSWKEEMELYMESPWYTKLLLGAPEPPVPFSEDSSTGLGQIFAKTAIDAHNAAIDRGDIEGRKINWDNWRERKEIWYKLRDDEEENIFYAGLVLKRKAEILGIDLKNPTNNPLEQVLAKYNGAAEYGRETIEYLLLFRQFND